MAAEELVKKKKNKGVKPRECLMDCASLPKALTDSDQISFYVCLFVTLNVQYCSAKDQSGLSVYARM